MKNWYAVYTRPHWEKKVATLLSRGNYENYCPLSRTISQWADRKKIIYRPLFASYVFIHVAEKELFEVKKTDGVINLVHWLGRPAVIRDIEIEMIKRFLNEHNTVEVTKLTVNVNDMVKIINGPLMEKEGCVIEVKSNKVKLILPSLGYSITAEVARDNIVVYSTRRAQLYQKSIS
jgi:transcription antitermination factor NusG